MTNTVIYKPEKYAGNGVTREFSFKFKIFDESDLNVYIEDDNGNQKEIELDVDYNVLFSDSGGSVTLKIPPGSGSFIIISSNVPNIQDITYSTSTGFSAKTVEGAFDKNVAMIQQLAYDNARSLKVPIGAETLNLSLPAPNKGKTLKWNDDETGLINSTANIDEIGEAVELAITSSNGAIEAANNAQSIVDNATLSINQKLEMAQELLSEAKENAEKAQFYAENVQIPLPPFCVNSGAVDENGNSNFLKLDGNILNLHAPIVYTLASGVSYKIKNDISVDISALQPDTYNIFYNHATSEIVLYSNRIFKQRMRPSAPVVNDIWLDISIKPYSEFIFSGEDFIKSDLIPLGLIIIEDDSEEEYS